MEFLDFRISINIRFNDYLSAESGIQLYYLNKNRKNLLKTFASLLQPLFDSLLNLIAIILKNVEIPVFQLMKICNLDFQDHYFERSLQFLQNKSLVEIDNSTVKVLDKESLENWLSELLEFDLQD